MVAEARHRIWETGTISSRLLSHSSWIKWASPCVSKRGFANAKRNWERNDWVGCKPEMNCGRATYRTRQKIQSNQWQKPWHRYAAHFGLMVNPLLQTIENVDFGTRQIVSFQNFTEMSFVQFQNVVHWNFVDIFGQQLQCLCFQVGEHKFLSHLQCPHTVSQGQSFAQNPITMLSKRWNTHRAGRLHYLFNVHIIYLDESRVDETDDRFQCGPIDAGQRNFCRIRTKHRSNIFAGLSNQLSNHSKSENDTKSNESNGIYCWRTVPRNLLLLVDTRNECRIADYRKIRNHFVHSCLQIRHIRSVSCRSLDVFTLWMMIWCDMKCQMKPKE